MNEGQKEVVVEPIEQNLSSVEIKHTTKGDTWCIKCYNDDIFKAKEQALTVFEDLRQKFEQ